jgi:hypothetical protein
MTAQQRAKHENEGLFTLKKTPGAGFCVVAKCRNLKARHKIGLCHKCAQHRWRMKNPKQSVFQALRDHARERGIAFTINADYLEGILDAHRFLCHEALSHGEKLSIERLDSKKPYEKGNLTILTVSENVARGNRERHLPEYIQHILDRKRKKAQESGGLIKPLSDYETDCPF